MGMIEPPQFPFSGEFSMCFSFMRLTILVSLCFGMPHHCGFVQIVEAAAVEPLKVLIVAGGCCHDYATQTKLLKKGIEERINASVEVIYNPDTSTEARFDIYESDGWARDFDVVIHDECSANVSERPYVDRILNAHRNGVPAVNLHCAMHSYRWGNFQEPVADGADNSGWYEMIGLQSSRHGPQSPIDVTYSDHVIAEGLSAWKTVNEELDALMFLAFLIENFVRKTKRLKLVEVIHLLKEITNVEMDLRFEAAAASELYENTKNDNFIKVPKIYWNFTSKQTLALDRIDSIPIRDTERLKNSNVDFKKLSRNLIQTFLKQAVRDGFFHADMHQGNLFVDTDGNILPIDFGIMGRLDKNNKKYLAEILYGFIKRDYNKVAQIHLLAGLVPPNTSKDELAQALRSIGEPIFGQAIKDISGGNLLSQLFDITEKFNMQTQTQLLLLQKTMVSVEGLARKLNPEANIWEISKPILEDWIKSEKGPESKIKKTIEVSKEVLEKIPDLPDSGDSVGNDWVEVKSRAGANLAPAGVSCQNHQESPGITSYFTTG